MPVEGEYMQRHDSGAELRRERLKWDEPGLIELTRARKRARGNCTDGSGDTINCVSGNIANQHCFPLGSTAGNYCQTGSSATVGCATGNTPIGD